MRVKFIRLAIFVMATYIYKYIKVKNMRRISRRLSEETRKKISVALKGKPKTESHRKALAAALVQYWATIPAEENEAES